MNGGTVALALSSGRGLCKVALGILEMHLNPLSPSAERHVGFSCPVLRFPGPAREWELHREWNN